MARINFRKLSNRPSGNVRQVQKYLPSGMAFSLTLAGTPILANAPAPPSVWQSTVHWAAPSSPATSSINATKLQNNSSSTATGAITKSSHSTTATHNLSAASSSLSNSALDLASSQANVLASNLAGFHTLTLVVGGVKETVSLNSKLTGAEAIAAEQILAGGSQTVKIAANGEAVGGTITLNSGLFSAIESALGGSISTLTISSGVKVVDTVSLLSLTGSLDNYGSILTASGTAHGSDEIVASSIINASGALISYYSGNGLYAASPVLEATSSIINNGTISSASNLTLNAPLVINVAGVSGNTPVINARQNIDINTGALTNAGSIISSSGNITISAGSAPGGDGAESLSILNNAGTIKALAGEIDLSTVNSALTVSGGNLLSQQLDLSAANGTIDLNAGNVSGLINASGESVHIITASNQHLGDIDTSGDPQFVSTTGSITINGTIAATDGANLAIIAAGNIVSGTKGLLDTSTTTNGNGGNLTLIAGASVTGSDTTAVVASGAGSSTGGLIDLTGKNGGTGAITEITTAGTGAAGNGGYIEMVAYAGSTSGSGTISIPTKVIIDAAGSGTGTNGNVTLMAGATSGTAITTGAIVGEQVKVLSETPTAATGGVTFTNGTSSSGIGGFSGDGTTTASIELGAITASQSVAITTGASVTTGKITADGSGTGVSGTAGGGGGTISVAAVGNITTGELDAFGGGGSGGGTGGSLNGGAGGAGGTITLDSSSGAIVVTGNINVSGGGGGGGAGGTNTTAAGSGGSGGTAGTVNLTATTNIAVSGEVYAYNGGAGGAGGAANTSALAAGGGGGGGSYGGAGGGGAGGVASTNATNAAGGGGGGSIVAPGGGGAGTTGDAGTATGGSGGGYIALGAGGLSSTKDSNGATASGTRGGSGGKGGSTAGGTGGTSPRGGSGGASTLSSADGAAGSQAQVVAGDGTLNITINGGTAGSSKTALKFETGQLAVTGTEAGTAYLSSVSGAQVNVTSVTLGSQGNLLLTSTANAITGLTGGTIDVTGAVTGGSLALSTSGKTGSIDINNTLDPSSTISLTTAGSAADIMVSGLVEGTSATLSTVGTITTSGSGSIAPVIASLTATGAINAATDATYLTVIDKSAGVTITQGANTISLIGSSTFTGTNTFTLDSTGQLIIAGAIIGSTTGTITLDNTGTAGGVMVAGTLSSGKVNITSAGSAGITGGASGKVTAGIIALTSANNIGSSSSPLIVDNNLSTGKGNALNISTGSNGSAYVKDLGTTDLALDVTSDSSGLISVSSAALAFNIVQLPVANITLIDTNVNGVTTLNSNSDATALFGNGNGVVAITSGNSIYMNANTAGIAGTSVNLTSLTGDVGGEIGLTVNAANITASAAKGEVNITTNETGTVNFTCSPGVQLYFTDTANNANLILSGDIAATFIQVQATGTTASITSNATLGISAKDNGYQVSLLATDDITVNGNVIADDVSFGSNRFTGDPVLLGALTVNGTVTADQSVLLADNQSQGITINAAMTGNQIRMMSDVDNITINASLTGATNPEGMSSNINLSSAGANVVFASGVSLSATGYISVTTNTSAIGSLASPLITKAPTVDLSFGGSVYIDNTSNGTLTLSATSTATTGAFIFNNTGGGVAFEGNVSSGTINLSGTGAISIGASSDYQSASLVSSGALAVTGTAAINNYGTLSGTTVALAGTSFSNINPTQTSPALTATLAASSVLSITSPGALTINGASGSITTPAGGALSLIAVGAITVGNTKTDPLADVTTSDLHSLVVSAGGNFSVGWSGITVVTDSSGDGGIINIAANNLVDNGAKLTGAFDLFANGATATGANIVLDLPGSTAGITTGTTTGDYNISAVGTSGAANIELVSGGNITANMSNLLFNGSGSSSTPTDVALLAGGKLVISGTFTTRTGTGAYGTVALSSGSSTPFVVGAASGATNGIINQSISGSSVSITDNSGITINAGFSVTAESGNLTITTAKLLNNGSVSTPDVLTLASSGNIIYPATGTFTMTGLVLDSTAGNVTISGSLPTVDYLALLAPKGTITLPSALTSISVSADGTNGGTIIIDASAIKSGAALAFNAPATTGTGGTIDLTLTGSSGLTVGTGAYTFDVANGGTTTAGSLTVLSGGNLTVNGDGLTLGSGSGANLSLLAGSKSSGALLLSNIANLTSQTFDNLTLQSNISQSFTLGGAVAKGNGIIDAGINLTAQTVTVQNAGGGIVQGSGGVLKALAASNAMTLIAGGTGIGLSGTSTLTVSAGSLNVTAAKGSAYITNSAASDLTTVTVGKTFDYISTQAITAANAISAPTLILNVGSITPTIATNATSIGVNATGAISLTDSQSAIVSVSNLLSTNGAVSLVSNGAITTSATSSLGGTAITLAAGGTAAGNVIIGNAISTTGTVDLTAAGKGTITESSKTAVITAGTLNLTTSGGDIGTSATSPLVIDTGALSVNTGTTTGNAFIKNNDTTATVLNASSAPGTFSYSGYITGTSGSVNASYVLLTLGDTTATLTTDAATLQVTATAGNLNVADTQTGLLKINNLSIAAGAVTIGSEGAITTTSNVSGTGAVALTAGGPAGTLTIGGNVTSTTSTVSLTATGTGSMVESKGTIVGTTVNLTTAGGNIGAATKTLLTSASTLNLATGGTGLAYVTNTDSAASGSVTLNSATLGSLAFTENNSSKTNTGSLTINSIDAKSGAITVVSNEQVLNVTAGSSLLTYNGNITLQNTYAANGTNLPSIDISAATATSTTTIHASSTGSTTTGNVYIALGTLPTASSLKVGTIPTGGSPAPVITTAGTTVFFATSANPTGSITTNSNDVLTGIGRDLSFTTGKDPSTQITLGDHVTIIADPPAGLASQATVSGAGSSLSSIGLSNATSSLFQSSTLANNLDANYLTTASTNSGLASLNQQQSTAYLPSQSPWQSTVDNAGIEQAGNAGKMLTGEVSKTRKGQAKSRVSSISAGSRIDITARRQDIPSGASLIAPERNTTIDTPFGRVSIAKDSVALLIVSEQGLAVYDLHDTHKNAVVINHIELNEQISVRPGSNLLLTSSGLAFEQANPNLKVAYRKIKSQSCGKNLKVYKSEFDIASLIQSLVPLRQMIASNDPAMRKTMERTIKTAAILSQLNDGEPYRFYAPVEMTASLPRRR